MRQFLYKYFFRVSVETKAIIFPQISLIFSNSHHKNLLEFVISADRYLVLTKKRNPYEFLFPML